MLILRASLVLVLSSALCSSPAMAAHRHHGGSSHRSAATSSSAKSGRASTKSTSASSTKGRKGRRSHTIRGQQAIDSNRVTEIQQALIREHYLTSEPNGSWDSATQAAMQKYQADQGWQTKLLPDSRALMKLGLGPDYSGAINAKTGNFAPPPPDSSIPTPLVAGFAAGSRAATAENR